MKQLLVISAKTVPCNIRGFNQHKPNAEPRHLALSYALALALGIDELEEHWATADRFG